MTEKETIRLRKRIADIKRTLVSEKRKGKLQSVPDGEWVFFDKNGNEINRVNYRNGVKQK